MCHFYFGYHIYHHDDHFVNIGELVLLTTFVVFTLVGGTTLVMGTTLLVVLSSSLVATVTSPPGMLGSYPFYQENSV